ncbi:MAG: hypothetical protein ABIR59_08170 [Gemmatimonadales bacterium]
MTRKLLLSCAALVGSLVMAASESSALSATTTAESDEAAACHMYTGCPNSSTQLCAIIHLEIMGAGVEYHCYQPVVLP